MMLRLKKLLIPVLVLAVISTVMAYAAPGDDSDPLITLSYITDILLPDVDSRIDKKVETALGEALTDIPQDTSSGGDSFNLVNVNAKYSIIGDEGTEFVVRSGTGNIIATSQGGVADLTEGLDLADGTQVPLNHHLLIPRSDKRGIKFETDAIVLVKGTYRVSK